MQPAVVPVRRRQKDFEGSVPHSVIVVASPCRFTVSSTVALQSGFIELQQDVYGLRSPTVSSHHKLKLDAWIAEKGLEGAGGKRGKVAGLGRGSPVS